MRGGLRLGGVRMRVRRRRINGKDQSGFSNAWMGGLLQWRFSLS